MKLTIKNRKNQNIVVLIDKVGNQKGLAFVMHGLSGNKEQDHIELFAKAFSDNHYAVVRFDTTNTFGESDGNYEDATVTNYYEDLEDVIEWAKTQDFYQEPFCLAGHSLGSMCITLYAQKCPNSVKALAPISTTISGKLSLEQDFQKMNDWKESGWIEKKSVTPPYQIKKLKWSHMEDRLKYDILKKVQVLKMPILLIVGENDAPENQKLLFDAIPHNNKEMHIIKGAPHVFEEKEHLDEVYFIFDKWIQQLG